MASETQKKNTIAFKYDNTESLSPDGYLTPVYFNIQVLIRYMYDSRFYCRFASETYGSIGNDDFEIEFGINSNCQVIFWLGDIMERLPIKEQFYLLVENISSQHNLKSEFYEGQINANFTEPTKPIACLNEIVKLNSTFHNKFHFYLYKEQSIEARLYQVERYKRIVLNNEDDFKRFISELNEITNENTANTELKKLFNDMSIDIPSGTKGNKLLGLVYKEFVKDTENLIAPFFYLYDLRLWSDHSIDKTTYNEVLIKLALRPDASFSDIMNALLEAITISCKNLINKIKELS